MFFYFHKQNKIINMTSYYQSNKTIKIINHISTLQFFLYPIYFLSFFFLYKFQANYMGQKYDFGHQAQFKYIHVAVISILLFLSLLINIHAQNQIFKLKTVINSHLQLTKSLAISPQNNQVIIGSTKGIITVFNYQTGQLVKQIKEHNSQILIILWQNQSQGLITISVDPIKNKSLVIQRAASTYQQIHRWQFDEYIYNADAISTRYDSYIGLNFMTRVQQYHLRTKKKTTVYNATGNRRFIQMSYSSQYSYLYLSGNGQFMYALKCGSVYGYYYGTSDIISRFQADKHNVQHTPVIYKQQKNGFQILDPNYKYNVTFPDQKIDYYKYCPKYYILGITIDQKIRIYSRDYSFQEFGVIQTFKEQGLFILSLSCQNERIIATGSDNKIYVYQIFSPSVKTSNTWIMVLIVAGGITLILIVMSALILRYRKKKHQTIKKESLLSSVQKQSIVSEVLTV